MDGWSPTGDRTAVRLSVRAPTDLVSAGVFTIKRPMAARLPRLLLVFAVLLGAAVPSPAAAAVVRLPTSQEIVTSVVPNRGVDLPNARSYFGARYYRADIGRFTTIDPVYTWQENLVDPQRWNRYAYARNNPLKYVDPDGRWIETLWDIANVVMGAKSAVDNFRSGNILSGVVDTGGAIVDLAAAVVPVVPGGVGTAIKAARAVERVDDALDAKKVISLSKARYGEAAQHAEDAIRAGQPAVLTVDRAGAAANRSASIGGRPKVPGKQLDEYPPAMFREGGAGASVRPVNPTDNMAAGACIGNACRVLPDGTRVRIEIVK